MAHLLIVDDEPSIVWGLRKLVEQMGHQATTAASGEEALELVKGFSPDAIVLDVRLPGIDGLTAMQRLHARLGHVPVIIITAHGELSTAVEAVRGGAFDYLTKPFDLSVAERALERALRAVPPAAIPEDLEDRRDPDMVGVSQAMRDVFKRIALVASTEACVHLCGERGTGKELAARAIHRYSRRGAGPWVAASLASLDLADAERTLFGETGAGVGHKGLLEQAHGGTLFLDDVGGLPLALQSRLLQALEQGEVWPRGAGEAVRCDARILSASEEGLAQRVAAGQFRPDLYFRLTTFEITLPPLRERVEDIGELCRHFLDRLAARGEVRATLAPETLAELRRRAWRGNIAELRSAIEHAAVLARGGIIVPEQLPPPALVGSPAESSPDQSLRALVQAWTEHQLRNSEAPSDLHARLMAIIEPPLFQVVLRACHHQYATAARILGLHRATLRKKAEGTNRGSGRGIHHGGTEEEGE